MLDECKQRFRKKLMFVLLFSVPPVYNFVMLVGESVENMPAIVEKIFFGFPVGYLLYVSTIYNYLLGLIMGIGEGKAFIGDGGFVYPSSFGVASITLIVYLIMFCGFVSLTFFGQKKHK